MVNNTIPNRIQYTIEQGLFSHTQEEKTISSEKVTTEEVKVAKKEVRHGHLIGSIEL